MLRLLLLLLLACGAGVARAEPIPVSIGFVPAADFVTVFAAQDEGFFARHNLDAKLVKMPIITNIPPALMSGSLDIGGSTATVLLQSGAGGLDFVAIDGVSRFLVKNPKISVVVRANSDIANAQGLEGKRVGVPGLESVADVGLQAWLMQNNVPLDKVSRVEANFPQMSDMLANGSVDAVAVLEPFRSKIINVDGRGAPNVESVGDPQQGGEFLDSLALRRFERREFGMRRLGHRFAVVAGHQRDQLAFVVAPAGQDRCPNDVGAVLVARAVGDETAHAVQQRRGVQHVAVGKRQTVQVGEAFEQSQREKRNVPFVRSQVPVLVAQRFEFRKARGVHVAQLFGQRAVARDEVDDDAVAQRALAYDDRRDAQVREGRDEDGVAGHDDVGAARIHPGQLLALGFGHREHAFLQRFQPREFERVPMDPAQFDAALGRVDGGQAHDRAGGADTHVELIAVHAVHQRGERVANVQVEPPGRACRVERIAQKRIVQPQTAEFHRVQQVRPISVRDDDSVDPPPMSMMHAVRSSIEKPLATPRWMSRASSPASRISSEMPVWASTRERNSTPFSASRTPTSPRRGYAPLRARAPFRRSAGSRRLRGSSLWRTAGRARVHRCCPTGPSRALCGRPATYRRSNRTRPG